MATSLAASEESASPLPATRSGDAPGHGPASFRLIGSFVAVYLIWGSTYLAIRVGLESFPPLLLAGIRHLAGGALLFLLSSRGAARPNKAQWLTAAITGLLLLFGGNGGVCWAEQSVPSGIAALLVSTVTLWMVLVDWIRPHGRRPSLRVLAGIVMGFAGMLVLVGPSRPGSSGRVDPLGAAVLVLASFSWACGSLYSKHGPLPGSPLLAAGMQGLCGGATLLVVGLLSGEGSHFHLTGVSLRAWLAAGYLVVFGSCIAFSAYLYILKKSAAARVATYAFVNPVVAIILGWGFAGEELSGRTFLAAAVILTAVVLVITAPQRGAAGMLPAAGET
jgi:drug/metabolite transporter (DMT)-like permease